MRLALAGALALAAGSTALAQPMGQLASPSPVSTPAVATPAAATPAAATPVSATPAPATTAPATTPAPPTPAPYRFVYRATPSPATTPFPGPNPPQISEIDVSDQEVVTPGILRVRVLTSDAVTSVVAETFGREIAIPHRSAGLFALDTSIPEVPAFLKNRSYDITFVASVADGRTTAVTLPLILR